MARAAPSHRQIDSLTGIRAVAALLVVVAHLAERGVIPDNGVFVGELGVLIFFSLSGFLMAFIYLRKPLGPRIALHYAIARFARIGPAYLMVVICSFLLHSYIDHQFVYAISSDNLLRHLLFSGNVSALWSIPPEVQFYGLFLLAWLALDRFRTRGNLLWISTTVVLMAVLVFTRDRVPGTFVGSKVHIFVLGACAGTVRARFEPTARAFPYLLAAQGALILGSVLVFAGMLPLGFPDKPTLYRSLGAAFVVASAILVLSYPTPASSTVLGNRVLMSLGRWSFSMYLLNFPLIQWLHAPGAATSVRETLLVWSIVVVASFAGFELVERPGSALVRRTAGRLAEYARSQRAADYRPREHPGP